MSNTNYDSVVRDKVIRLHLEEGRFLRSVTQEFNLGSGTAKYWIDKYRKDYFSSKEGIQHKLFENLLKRNFTSAAPNQKWCTNFTYLALTQVKNVIIVVSLISMVAYCCIFKQQIYG